MAVWLYPLVAGNGEARPLSAMRIAIALLSVSRLYQTVEAPEIAGIPALCNDTTPTATS